jgi:hypothetical protein
MDLSKGKHEFERKIDKEIFQGATPDKLAEIFKSWLNLIEEDNKQEALNILFENLNKQ